jgi:hypothetical protein
MAFTKGGAMGVGGHFSAQGSAWWWAGFSGGFLGSFG